MCCRHLLWGGLPRTVLSIEIPPHHRNCGGPTRKCVTKFSQKSSDVCLMSSSLTQRRRRVKSSKCVSRYVFPRWDRKLWPTSRKRIDQFVVNTVRVSGWFRLFLERFVTLIPGKILLQSCGKLYIVNNVIHCQVVVYSQRDKFIWYYIIRVPTFNDKYMLNS